MRRLSVLTLALALSAAAPAQAGGYLHERDAVDTARAYGKATQNEPDAVRCYRRTARVFRCAIDYGVIEWSGALWDFTERVSVVLRHGTTLVRGGIENDTWTR